MTTNNSQQKSFLASLFDFGFTSFVTLRFLKVIYTIVVVLILVGGAFVLIAGLSTGSGIGIVGAIIFAPLFTLVYLVFARIAFEVIAMFFRIGDNTFMAVQLLRGGNPGQWNPGAQPGYGPMPYGPQGGADPSAGYGPTGYGTGAGDSATAPTTGLPYASQPNFDKPNFDKPNFDKPDYGQPQAGYGQPQGGGSPYDKPSETPPSPPAQGSGPTTSQ